MRTILRTIAAAAVLALPLTVQAQSELLTADFGGTQATSFQCEDGFDGFCFTRGPEQVGTNGYGVTLSSGLTVTNASGSAIGTGYYGLGFNGGWWGNPDAYAGTDGTGNSTFGLRFEFNRPIYSVGAWMNYATVANSPVTLTAYGAGGVLLGQYDLRMDAPIFTPNQINGQQFRGITTSSAIFAFELAGSYLVTRNLFVSDAQALFLPRDANEPDFGDQGGPNDDTIGQQADILVTPEPSTYALMAAGLVGLAAAARRRRAL